MAFASSFDQIGVFARETDVAARVFEIIAGEDSHDSTTAAEPVEPFIYDEERASLLTVGISPDFESDALETPIRDRYHALKSFLQDSGIRIRQVALPHMHYGIAAYYVLVTAEASSNLARFDGIRYGYRNSDSNDLESVYLRTRTGGFGPEVQRRIMLGTFVLSAGYYEAYYDRAQRVRRLIRQDFVNLFKEVDILLTPTTPTLPFPIGSKTADPLTMYMSDVYTVPMSLAGVPAMNIPVGFTQQGLPVGMQLTADYFQEETIFQLSRFIEQHFRI